MQRLSGAVITGPHQGLFLQRGRAAIRESECLSHGAAALFVFVARVRVSSTITSNGHDYSLLARLIWFVRMANIITMKEAS
jgi:hypothetical protein